MWSGINVPRRCLGRRWTSGAAAVPATTCAAEASAAASSSFGGVASSMHTYYGVDEFVAEQSAGVDGERVSEATAWSGLHVASRPSRWPWSSQSISTTWTDVPDRSEDVRNGNRVDNRSSPKPGIEQASGDSWSGIGVPRRAGTFGGYTRSSPAAEALTDETADRNGNHMRVIRDDSITAGAPGKSGQGVNASSVSRASSVSGDRHTRPDISSSPGATDVWGGVNVPRRTRNLSTSTSTSFVSQTSEATSAASRDTDAVQSDTWGNTGVPRRARLSDVVSHPDLSPQKELRDATERDNSVWTGVNVPKRNYFISRDNGSSSSSISPPPKQHKQDTIDERASVVPGRWDKDSSQVGTWYTSSENQHYSGNTASGEESGTWGGIGVPRRSSGRRYGSASAQQIERKSHDVVETAEERRRDDANTRTSFRSTPNPTSLERATRNFDVQSETCDKREASSDRRSASSYFQRFCSSYSPVKNSEGNASPEKLLSEATSGTWSELRPGLSDTGFASSSVDSKPSHRAADTDRGHVESESSTWRGTRTEWDRTASVGNHHSNRSSAEHLTTSGTQLSGSSPYRADSSRLSGLRVRQEETGEEKQEHNSQSWGNDVPRRSRFSDSFSSSTSSALRSPTFQPEEAKAQSATAQLQAPTNRSPVLERTSNNPEKQLPKSASMSFAPSDLTSFEKQAASKASDSEATEGSEAREKSPEVKPWIGSTRRRRSSYGGSLQSEPTEYSWRRTRSLRSSSSYVLGVRTEDSGSTFGTWPRRPAQRSSSFSSDLRLMYTPERQQGRVERSKSVTWSDVKPDRRTSASEVTPIIKSRSQSRENSRRWSVTDVDPPQTERAKNLWSVTTEVPQTERARGLIRSRSFTAGSKSSRSSVSPRKARDRNVQSPSKSVVVQETSRTLNWSWSPASPLLKKGEKMSSEDGSDTFDEDPDVSLSTLRNLRRRSYAGSRQTEVATSTEDGTSWTGINVPRRSASANKISSLLGRRASQDRSEDPDTGSRSVADSLPEETHSSAQPSEEPKNSDIRDKWNAVQDQSSTKLSSLEENRRRLAATTVTAWELGSAKSPDGIVSPSSHRDFSSPWSKEEDEGPPADVNWGGIDVPRRCLGYRTRSRHSESGQFACRILVVLDVMCFFVGRIERQAFQFTASFQGSY